MAAAKLGFRLSAIQKRIEEIRTEAIDRYEKEIAEKTAYDHEERLQKWVDGNMEAASQMTLAVRTAMATNRDVTFQADLVARGVAQMSGAKPYDSSTEDIRRLEQTKRSITTYYDHIQGLVKALIDTGGAETVVTINELKALHLDGLLLQEIRHGAR